MAGSYADPTSWRMALDRDGSKFVAMNSAGAVVDISASNMIKANDESSDISTSRVDISGLFGGGIQLTQWIAVVFPELRDIDGYMLAWDRYGSTVVVEVSTNTTNGQDGTWSQINGSYAAQSSTANWRTAVTANTALAVRAIRFRDTSSGFQNCNLYSLHLYGEIAPGENPDRLVFWDDNTDTKMAPVTLDWGNVPRSSSADRYVRVKNLSPTMTAYDVRISFDILTDATPSVPAQHLVSYSGGAFLSQVNIGALGPGSISGVITLRRVTPSNAALGLYWPRVSAVADSFV